MRRTKHRDRGGHPLPPSGRPDPTTGAIAMAAFAKRVLELYIQGATRYPMPMIWTV